MRRARKFHPEWGYLAPTPTFARRMRVVLVATAVGATAGAGVGLSWVSHPATETSVAARTLVGPLGATTPRGTAPGQVTQTSIPHPTEKQPGPPLEVHADVATRESSTTSTRAPESVAALAKASAATSEPAAPPQAAKAHVVNVTPIKRKTKRNVTWRYASRDEALGLVPGEYYTRRSSYEYRASGVRGGYYRESGRWGGYYGDGGGRPYQDW
jgi:hypothetical protein